MIPRFRMVRISLDQFATLSDRLPEGFNVGISLSFSFSVDTKKIACIINVDICDAENNRVVILKSTCEFAVHDDDWNGFIKESRFVASAEFLRYLGSQAVGVARGILFCKTEGTPFASLVLPPVNVAKMIKDGIDKPIES